MGGFYFQLRAYTFCALVNTSLATRIFSDRPKFKVGEAIVRFLPRLHRGQIDVSGH